MCFEIEIEGIDFKVSKYSQKYYCFYFYIFSKGNIFTTYSKIYLHNLGQIYSPMRGVIDQIISSNEKNTQIKSVKKRFSSTFLDLKTSPIAYLIKDLELKKPAIDKLHHNKKRFRNNFLKIQTKTIL